jgi:CubicO group peptidase (beta-lactamase class C family)
MSFSKLTSYLNSFYAEKNIPGLGCAVYYRRKLAYEHYAGFRNVDKRIPFGPDTIFKLYSATKIATAVSVLQLWEDGRISLDAPVSDYIPEYKTLTVKDEDGIRPAENTLTVRHLLSMRGGVTNALENDEVKRVIKETDGKAGTLDIVRAMASEPLLFEPGTRFKYSACHTVLGGLVEAVTGKRFGEVLNERIFAPLGMTDTSFTLPPEKEARFAPIYNGFNALTGKADSIGETYNLNPTANFESGGGGLYSTVKDYILLTEALCNFGLAPNGARILTPETVNALRENQLDETCLRDFAEFGGPSKEGYGYGLGVRTLLNREKNNALSQNGEFGWDGARGCYVCADPDSRLALFYAQQEGGSEWWHYHGTIRNFAFASVWND